MWTARDGAPQGVHSLAQSPDGELWIGTVGGLYRFDGRTFHEFQSPAGEPDLPAGAVCSVLVRPDGTVWAGFFEEGIARIAQGRVTIFDTADGKLIRGVKDIKQSLDGSIWALSAHQDILRFGKDGTWHVEPSPRGASGGMIQGIFIDSSNTLWLAQGGVLYQRPLDQSRYYATDVKADQTSGFAEATDGSLWVADVVDGLDRGRTQHVDRFGNRLETLPNTVPAVDLLYAPGGSLIMASQYHGLRRFWVDPSVNRTDTGTLKDVDSYTYADGLSSDATRTLMLDEDGNLWVGGRKGLDRFRKARLTPFVAVNPNGEWQICSSRHGDVWVASDSQQLYRISHGTTKSFSKASDFHSIFCEDNGDTWLVNHIGIWRMRANRLTRFPPIPATAPSSIHQVVSTPAHVLFASVSQNPAVSGLWQYKSNRWTKVASAGELGRAPVIEYVDSEGRLWTGYNYGFIGLPLENGGRLFSSGDPGLGIVYAILQTSYGLIAAGLNGVAILRDDRFQMLSFEDRTSSRGVAGLVESFDGDLWLNASHGLVRIRAADLRSALKHPHQKMKSERITEGDYIGPGRLGPGSSDAARDDRGNLWFATLNGVLHIDPESQSARTRLPILSIQSIDVDGAPLGARTVVDPGPHTLAVRFLGVNLSAPRNVIYRYRLDGLDDAWQEGEHRMEAIYTHLRAGTYKFRVDASNGDGIWTQPVSSASFTVLPNFYQTSWFLMLCGLASLGMLWLVYAARVRSIAHAINARAKERADERIKIARELHDTLLQGIQGLMLTLHVVGQKASANGDSRATLERALSSADKIIIEGRNRLNSLRSEHLSDSGLLNSLEEVAKGLKLDDNIHCEVKRSGEDFVLHPHVAEEVFCMAREALTNAFRHSGGTQINLELAYGTRLFSMTCRDNGCGFVVPQHLNHGQWGLKGLFERAQRLGGKMQCRSAPTKGTEILFTLVSYRAYKNRSVIAHYLHSIELVVRARAKI